MRENYLLIRCIRIRRNGKNVVATTQMKSFYAAIRYDTDPGPWFATCRESGFAWIPLPSIA